MRTSLLILSFLLTGCFGDNTVNITPEDLAKGYNVCMSSNEGIDKIRISQWFENSVVKGITFSCTNGVTYYYQVVPEDLVYAGKYK